MILVRRSGGNQPRPTTATLLWPFLVVFIMLVEHHFCFLHNYNKMTRLNDIWWLQDPAACFTFHFPPQPKTLSAASWRRTQRRDSYVTRLFSTLGEKLPVAPHAAARPDNRTGPRRLSLWLNPSMTQLAGLTHLSRRKCPPTVICRHSSEAQTHLCSAPPALWERERDPLNKWLPISGWYPEGSLKNAEALMDNYDVFPGLSRS